MLLLLVQGKLTNLTVEERFAFNVSLRMFTRSIVIQRRVEDLQLGVESYQKKLNLTKLDSYRSDLKRKEAYTAYSNLQGFIYQYKDKRNRLMRIDELHKFSDGMLTDVYTALDDHLKGIQMQVVDGVVQPVAPSTAEQRLAKKNELKARGTLLMALPEKHKLKLNIRKDAKSLMEAIEKRFAMIGAFIQIKNQQTMPSWHSPPQVLPVLIIRISMPTSPVHDRYKSRERYHADPPPYTGTFMPPKPSVPIIKDWVSDSEDESDGNISYLSDFEEINGGYVAFGGNPKGGKITGKGKIRKCKLDFDDVYFVKELKFNLFSVTQICDKTKKHDDKTKRDSKGKSPVELSTGVQDLSDDFEEFSDNSTNEVNAASTPVTTVGPNSINNTNTFSAAGPSNTVVSLTFGLDGKSSFMDPS
nr:ribonuclease H-like domain-containing protein [Tanacetum cinerariifolium]